MSDEGFWVERAQSAEARLETLKHAYEPAIARIRAFKTNFGVREESDGTLHINFDKFAAGIGIEGALELREIIDEIYRISGEPGEKPKVRVSSAV